VSESLDVQNTPLKRELRLAYYGDDFTGSTDALECLALAGLRTMLFLEPPTREWLARLPGLDAIGVAGRSRSLPTAELAADVQPALSSLRELSPRHVHYKVCSTFDSSPTIGSIGRVIDEAAPLFPAPFVPLVVGAPPLGRWCVFGNLFAQVAIGSESEVCRLDRHPTMRNHPTTPADESDLRLHLARQTNKSIALFDIRQIGLPIEQASAALTKLLERRPDIVLFDVLETAHLAKIGALIDSYAQMDAPLFSVGSSGVEMALAALWAENSQVPQATPVGKVARIEPVLVISGSCSPVTAAQIEFALASGFGNVPLDIDRCLDGRDAEQTIGKTSQDAMLHLAAGRSVVVHTHPELTAPRLTNTGSKTAGILGTALGRVLAACASKCQIHRVCIAGGDTASYVARAIGIDSLEFIAPFTRGAPRCRLHSQRPEIDGLEAVFKAGQVGGPDLFVKLVEGAV
jgi:uncharacterized protein YgbK (DUF1537 family)